MTRSYPAPPPLYPRSAEVSMATTAIASNGMVHKMDSDRSSSIGSSSLTGSTISSSSNNNMIGDSTSSEPGAVGGVHMSRNGRKRSAPPYRTPTTPPFIDSGSQPSMALSFRVEADVCIADTFAGPIESHGEPLFPPEPGGVLISDAEVSIAEGGGSVSREGVLSLGEVEPFRDIAPWACADDRPWRKRARHARKVAALGMDGYGWEDEEEKAVVEGGMGGDRVMAGGGVGHGERRQRASEKKKVKASRKEYASKALQRNAMPLMDLVGVTAPLLLIVGISIVQNGPGI